MLTVYTNYVHRMERIADGIQNEFDSAISWDEVDCYCDEAIDALEKIYWQACDDPRIRNKELVKLEELRRWCCKDIRNAYGNYIAGVEGNF